jgi:malonyl-CoA/methylmalonyl-CoA synthetase
MPHNLFSLIQLQFLNQSDRILLSVPGGRSLTGSELDAETACMAAVLIDAGVEPGDRVSAQVEKGWMNVLLYLAVLRIGGVYLPLNSAYTESEVEYFLTDAEPRVHVCPQVRREHAESLVQSANEQLKVMTLDGDLGFLRDVFDDFKLSGRAVEEVVSREAADLASIIYTSGTTGKPKGAMISHSNLIANAEMLTEAWAYSKADTLLHALPLFHVHGLFVGLNLALVNGGPIILLPKFDPTLVLEVMPDTTVMMGVPTYYTRLLSDDRFNRVTSSQMRLYISGSAPLLVETSDSFFERTGHRILERYGMTETGMSCSNPLVGERRAGSVGPHLPGVSVRVMGDDGYSVAGGEIGSLEVKGPHVFSGYWKLPEKTASEFKGEWFITGDLAILSEDGYISIVGRDKDLIISGGLNIYPKEIEDVLNDQPDVLESAVVGVSHPDFGEGIVAILVGKKALDMVVLEAACREKLAGFKVPKRWLQHDALPRNTMGKVQKNLLRDNYKDSFTAK